MLLKRSTSPSTGPQLAPWLLVSRTTATGQQSAARLLPAIGGTERTGRLRASFTAPMSGGRPSVAACDSRPHRDALGLAATTPSDTRISALPAELWLQIASELPLSDVMTLRLTNKQIGAWVTQHQPRIADSFARNMASRHVFEGFPSDVVMGLLQGFWAQRQALEIDGRLVRSADDERFRYRAACRSSATHLANLMQLCPAVTDVRVSFAHADRCSSFDAEMRSMLRAVMLFDTTALLQSATQLRELRLDGAQMLDSSFAALLSLVHLETLDLRRLTGRELHLANLLFCLKQLKVLKVDANNLHGNGLRARAHANLEHLHVDFHRDPVPAPMAAQFFSSLSGLAGLQSLHLRGFVGSCDALAVLRDLPRLRCIEIIDSVLPTWEGVAYLHMLERLELRSSMWPPGPPKQTMALLGDPDLTMLFDMPRLQTVVCHPFAASDDMLAVAHAKGFAWLPQASAWVRTVVLQSLFT